MLGMSKEGFWVELCVCGADYIFKQNTVLWCACHAFLLLGYLFTRCACWYTMHHCG